MDVRPAASSGSATARWIVDAANVFGSRPDGWWRDRTRALERLVDEIVRWREVVGEPVLVVADGAPSARFDDGVRYGVEVRHAGTNARDAADDVIVGEVAASGAPSAITVVTSDRRLRERVGELGAAVEGSGAYLRRIAGIDVRRTDRALLAHFGVDESALLGRGGEARVFGVDDELVVRLPHPGTELDTLERRKALLDAIAGGHIGVATPEVVEHRTIGDRVVVVERRLPGRSALECLDDPGIDRDALVRDHLEVAARIADLPGAGDDFGSLIGDDRRPSFREWSVEHLTRSLARGGPQFSHLDPADVTDGLLDVLPAVGPVLTHLDAFLGNMLAVGGRISAVIDFGVLTAAAVRGLDPLIDVAYLAPEITPTSRPSDRDVAVRWARSRGLGEAVGPAERWIATMWTGAPEDERLRSWCLRMLS